MLPTPEADQQARAQALEVTRSFIVQAPAGSGKTALLTSRFVSLFNTVNHPEEIIAITFTRKSAAEMRHRILSQLTEVVPDRLRIMTIDAFCHYLVSQMPIGSKISENMVITENPEKLYQTAIQRLFLAHQDLQETPIFFHDFLFYLDNDMSRVNQLLSDILKNRDQWLFHLGDISAENIHNLEKAWKAVAPNFYYSPEQRQFILALSYLLRLLIAELKLVFLEYQAYDFIEIMLSALQALGEEDCPTDLTLALDYQIKHILIDEFQDTSLIQWRLLKKITAGWEQNDGRTLFLVGDPMQSIYRFRKADVSLFLEVQKAGMDPIVLHPLVLSCNFRSDKKLIDWFNYSFASLFPSYSQPDKGAIAYSPSVPVIETELACDQKGVFYHAVCDTEKIVALVKKYQYSSTSQAITMGILGRSRSHLKPIMTALEKHNIPFCAVEMDNLAEHYLIQDLLSLTSALLQPADRIAWLAILRAPWCGLTLSDLSHLAEADHQSLIWDLLLYWHQQQPDNLRLGHFMQALSLGMAMRGRVKLRELVEKTWLSLKGHLCLQTPQELRIAEQYFDLLDSTSDIQQIQASVLSLFASPTSIKNPLHIQIMTIHKAKGLEFDVVILPALEKYTRAEPSKLFLWEETLTNLRLAPIKSFQETASEMYQYLKNKESERAYYELQRLLYVAATRAKSALHLVFSLNTRKPAKNSFLHLLEHTLPAEIGLTPPKNSVKKKLERSYVQTDLQRLPVSALNQFTPRNVSISSARKNHYALLSIQQLQQKYLGIVIHEALCYMADYQKTPVEKFLQGRLYQLSGSLAGFEKIQQCITMIEKDPIAQWFLKPHKAAKSEYAVTGVINQKIIHAVIDRTFIDEQDKRWIIDYKMTFQHDIRKNQAHYLLQLRKYEKLFKKLESREICLGLYFPLTGEFTQC